MEDKKVALFDMDGTLFDYVGAMHIELEKLRSPEELSLDPFILPNDKKYEYLWKRMDIVKQSEDWWANLPQLKLGFDVYNMTKELGYEREILTQAPMQNPAALAGKLRCLRLNLEMDLDFTMTRNKGRHYGRILVDDFPGFINEWLKFRKKGTVIMPASKYNEGYSHPQVIRYDGKNKEEVRSALIEAMNR